jgi:DNA-binding NtrC family response regulator
MLKILLVLGRSLKPVVAELEEVCGLDILDPDESLKSKVTRNSYDVVIVERDHSLLPEIKGSDPRVEVIMLGCGDVDEVEAVKLGASECLPMPLDMARLRSSVEKIGEMVSARRETGELEKRLFERYTFAGVVGKNPRMLDIFNFSRRIAPYFRTVTILGETGTGKEEIAKALHSVSPVSDKPFVVCNCGGLVEHLIESELFGHKKGAFTGAVADKAGIFEAAGEGTVFLDEVGELPLSVQPHLLRVLQNGDFKRLGSTAPMKARCRVIAATNRDLATEVREGRFREDLFFRLTPLTINIPPLRERKDDIPLLMKSLLEKACERTGKKVFGFSRPVQAALMSYDWPGNVRELDNVVEHVAMLATEAFIRLEDLPAQIVENGSGNGTVARGRDWGDGPLTLDEVVKGHIERVLAEYDGNRTHAARALGISRRALLRKMEKYSID